MKLNLGLGSISILIIVLSISVQVFSAKVLFKHHNNKTTSTTTTEGSDIDNHGFVDLESHHQQHFSEAELERLCPSNDVKILKNLLATHSNCSTQNIDYWHDQCLCRYEKNVPCPKCPESSMSSSSPSTINNIVNFVIPNNKTGSGNMTAFNNATKPCFLELKNPSNNQSTSGGGGQFNLYNSGGGIINLYFYLNGQSQLQNTTDKPNNGTNITTTIAPVATTNNSTKKV